MYNETQHHQKQKAITTAPAIWGSSVDQVGADALIGQPRRDPSRAPSLMTHDCRNEATARPHPTSLGFKVSVKVERTTLSQSLRKNHGGACGPVGTVAPSVPGDDRPHPVPGHPAWSQDLALIAALWPWPWCPRLGPLTPGAAQPQLLHHPLRPGGGAAALGFMLRICVLPAPQGEGLQAEFTGACSTAGSCAIFNRGSLRRVSGVSSAFRIVLVKMLETLRYGETGNWPHLTCESALVASSLFTRRPLGIRRPLLRDFGCLYTRG